MGWNGQSLHMRMLLFQLPTCLPTLPTRLLHQGLNGQLFLCRKLLDEHIVNYFPCVGTLISGSWLKVQFSVVVLYSQTPCLLQILTGLPASRSHQTVFFRKLFRKNASGFILCFRALINRYCQEIQKAMVELMFVQNLWKIDSKHTLLVFLDICKFWSQSVSIVRKICRCLPAVLFMLALKMNNQAVRKWAIRINLRSNQKE